MTIPYILRDRLPAPAQKRKQCLLHWQITSKCALSCKHCFRGDERSKDLSLSDCLKILDSLQAFVRENNLDCSIIFIGGDPLLRDDFPDILKVAAKYQQDGIIQEIAICGNPERINEQTAEEMKSLGVHCYQFSIDGLEDTHDWFRNRGSFRRTVKAIKILRAAGLRTAVKFTLSRVNAGELLDVFRLVINEGVSAFTFGHIVPAGYGENLTNDMLTPAEYRQVLVKVVGFLDSLPQQHTSFRYPVLTGESSLYGLLFYESGRRPEYEQIMALPQRTAPTGKGLVFSVLPDGAVFLRRLIPIKIGQAPQDSFRKIYDSSELLRSLEEGPYTIRKAAENDKCRDCPALNHCGHELCFSYIASGSLFGPEPMCWRTNETTDSLSRSLRSSLTRSLRSSHR